MMASMPAPTIEDTAARLASLLTYAGGALDDPEHHDLVFERAIELQPLVRGPVPPDVWAVDGGQAVVADARSVQLVVTRAARVRWRDGESALEEEGELRPMLLGCGEERLALTVLGGLPVPPDSSVDINLLRDWGEWQAVQRCVHEASPGGLILIDGDLQPDWRIAPAYLSSLLASAADRGVVLAGVTKHSALARGAAPLLGQLEREAEGVFGPRAMWWAKVATTREPVRRVLAAKLDPDARFAFRVDLPDGVDVPARLGMLAAVADDAAFPGYPYPLSVADRLAACPSWIRDDVWRQVEESFDRAGVPLDVRERAFTDRHRLMERA